VVKQHALSLDWNFVTRQDRSDLQHFVCTRPDHRPPYRHGHGRGVHPFEWEYEVQCGLRDPKQFKLPHDRLLIGRDSEGIAAACAWQVSVEVGASGPYLDVFVRAVAVEVRHRGLGGACARAALLEMHSLLERDARASGLGLILVTAHVHIQNGPSQRLLASHGFERGGPLPASRLDPESVLEDWERLVVLPPIPAT